MRGVICALVTAIGSAMNPSPATADPLRVGITGGLVAANVATSGPDRFSSSAAAGGAIGGFLVVAGDRVIGVRPEVLLAWRRFQSSETVNAFTVSSRSVEVPVLVQVRLPSGGRTRAILLAGPQFSRIGAITQRIGSASMALDDQFKDLDVAATFGGGLELSAAHGAIVIDARVILGLRNLSEAQQSSLKSRAIGLFAGYSF